MKRNKFLFTFVFFAVTATSFSCNPGSSSKKVTLSYITAEGPSKSFYVNDKLYLSQISVYAIYSDSSYKKVTDFTCEKFDGSSYYTFSTAGTHSFDVSYQNKSTSFNITVKETQEQKDAYTVFIYMCPNNLESGIVQAQEDDKTWSYGYTYGLATIDIDELLSTTTSKPNDVNVLIQTGGTKKWGSYFTELNSNKAQRFEVSNHTLVEDTTYNKTMSEVNMGESSTLQSFLEWGIKKYPAEKYGLILWNHGGGMQGVCFDENHVVSENQDGLLNSEVKTALTNARNNTSTTSKFEWIAYDACLMSVHDVAKFNSANSKYMLSSQENVPGGGLNYTYMFNQLYTKPSNTKTFLNNVADNYISIYEGQGTYATMALLDLQSTYCTKYFQEWDKLTSSLNSKITSKSKCGSFITNVLDKSMQFGYDETSELHYYYDVYDVKSFLNLVNNNYSIDCTNIKNYLSNFVTSKYTTDYTTEFPCGLCLFYPTFVKSYEYAFYNENEAVSSTWFNFVNKYWY